MEAARAALDERLPGWEIDDLVPSEAVFKGKETERSVDMGILHWREMFNPRQLLTNVTALEALHEIQRQAADELARAASQGGRAVSRRSHSIRQSTTTDVSQAGTRSRTTVRNTFDRHDFAFKWSFAEFDGAAALLPWAVSQVVRCVSGHSEARTRSGDPDG